MNGRSTRTLRSELLDKVPPAVLEIAEILKKAGGRAFLVGGPLRDLLLGKQPADWDIATDLRPHELLDLFPDACQVGLEYGRILVRGVDVVSLRSERGYSDHRHPDKVEFGVPLREDLARRDFTVNAVAVDLFELEVFDPFGGLADLEVRVLRAVGDPVERFREDPLRILRAIRLKNCLNFNLDGATVSAIRRTAHLVASVSWERVFQELGKMLLSENVSAAIADLQAYGVGMVILPEVFCKPADRAATCASYCRPQMSTRLAALLHEVEDVARVLDRLKVASELREEVVWLTKNAAPEEPRVSSCADREAAGYISRKIMNEVGRERLEKLLDLKLAIWRADQKPGFPQGAIILAAGMLESDLMGWTAPVKLALGGEDVMSILGIGSGPQVGMALRFLEDQVLRNPAVNQREALTNMLIEWWRNRV